MRYSLIIPVFNRPDEVDELLNSLTSQTYTDFEVQIIEDGSQKPCKEIVACYAGRLDIHYHTKSNSGPGQSRNYGAERAQGEYLIILDSDCVLPPEYLQSIENELLREPADAFGGPDKAHPSFTPLQKAINYSMTSFFTTGGIRGGKKKMDRFYPRSFNMGIRTDVYHNLGGFSRMRFGEDIDFSIRIFQHGYSCRLFPDSWVWHKRRTDLRKFFKQVYNSGIARINLYKKYPSSLKTVHLLPAVFTLGCILLLFIALIGCLGTVWIFQMNHHYRYAPDMPGLIPYAQLFRLLTWLPLTPLALFSILILSDATRTEHSLAIGLRSVATSFVQLFGYGLGFLQAWWKRCIRKKDEFAAFEKNFYK